jgi:hypothetical protein
MPTYRESATIEIDGEAIGDYYPAERVTQLVLEIEHAIKASAECLLVERRAELDPSRSKLKSEVSRSKFKSEVEILASFPRRGSYLQEINLTWDVVANAAVAVMPLVPELLSKMSDAIELLKKILPLFASETPPPISVSESGDTITINGGINFNGPVNINVTNYILAGAVSGLATEIANQSGKGIDTVELREPGGEKLSIEAEDLSMLNSLASRNAVRHLVRSARDLKRQRSRYLAGRSSAAPLSPASPPEPIEATVDILAFDKTRRSGTLKVVSSGQLAPGRYSFELARRPETERAIAAMLQPRVHVICQQVGRRKLELIQVEARLP